MRLRPGVAKTGGGHQVVGERTVTVQRIGVEISEENDRQRSFRRAGEQLLHLQRLELRRGFLFQMRAEAAEIPAMDGHVHRTPAAFPKKAEGGNDVRVVAALRM